MKKLEQKINELKEGTNFDIPLIGSKGKLYRVTEKAIQINCVNNGMTWIPKSQICDIDQTTGEILLSTWIEQKINQLDKTSSGAY
tara:strand:+ start:151 stop:405 length:255 start_codon:yes stop_codon:yes gene_type:complete